MKKVLSIKHMLDCTYNNWVAIRLYDPDPPDYWEWLALGCGYYGA